MFLKSEGCASNLSDPSGRSSLAQYCAEQKLPYGEWGTPVAREVFTQYALCFQRKLVPNVENVTVTAVERSSGGFALRLSSGETLNAQQVIMATGMEHSAYIPEAIAQLPKELWSHTSEHYDLSHFKGADITVIGGGQSALETAALLSEEGASVHLLVREPSLVWNPVPESSPRSFFDRLRYPRTGLGDGLSYWMYCNTPQLFYHLPRLTRVKKANTVLGPAGAWWLKSRVIGRMPILSSHFVFGAEARGNRAILQIVGNGQPRNLTTDHVIAATGYRFDLRRQLCLSQNLRSQLRHEEQLPKLSSYFESSVHGLYFTGFASTNAFGPMMRFMIGTNYTAKRILKHISATIIS